MNIYEIYQEILHSSNNNVSMNQTHTAITVKGFLNVHQLDKLLFKAVT